MALKQGLTEVDAIGQRFEFLKPKGWWNYVPLALVCGAGLIWLCPISLGNANADVETTEATLALPRDPGDLPKSVSDSYIELMSGDHTDLQEDVFLARYVGKRLVLQLELVSVSSSGNSLFGQFRAGRNSDVFVYFDPAWRDHLADQKPGDLVLFRATVVEGDRGNFVLAEGQLF